MPSILDTIADTNNAQLHRLVTAFGAPDFVKSASAGDLRPAQQLKPLFYGDPRHLTYPLHTKASTWTNYGLFLDNVKAGAHAPVDVGAIEERILHAGKIHGISQALTKLAQAKRADVPVTEEALSDDDFALVFDSQSGVPGSKQASAPIRERYLPVRNAREVIKAAEYLQQYRSKFPYPVRREVAVRICEKAAEFGAAVPGGLRGFLEAQAGYGACASKTAIAMLEDRVQASRKGPGALTNQQLEMAKLADTLKKRPAAIRDVNVRVKIASVVDAFDRHTGILHMVSDGELPYAEDILFNLTRDKLAAAAEEHTHTIHGSIYRLDAIEHLKMADVRDALGEEVASALTLDGIHLNGEKAAEIIPTLDRHTASVFEHLMSAAGFEPVAKQASAASIKLENGFLQQLLASQ